MLCYSVLFTLSALWNTLSITAFEERTTLAIKEVFKNDYPIALSAQDFEELVIRSNVFVDKSLLIKEILEAPRLSLLNCPRGWGKSVNLHMTKTFLQIEVDKEGRTISGEAAFNYKLFRRGEIADDDGVQKLKAPLLIANYTSLLEKYQGQYPVIYVEFTGLEMVNFDQFLFHVKSKISKAFEQHTYLKKVLERKLKKHRISEDEHEEIQQKIYLFNEMLGSKETRYHVVHSLRFLCSLLNEHFGKRVIILVDDYDGPLHKIFMDKNVKYVKDIMKLYGDIFKKTFSSNEFLEKGIFSGMVDATSEFYALKDIATYNFLENDIYQFYGITANEANMLFDLLNVSQEKRVQAEQWYGGYKAGKNLNISIYNSIGIAQFLAEQRALNYWQEIRPIDQFFNEILCVDIYKIIFHSMLTRGEYMISIGLLKFFVNDFQDLKDSLNFPDNPPHQFLFKYLFAIGYFNFDEDFCTKKFDLRETYRIRYANRQINTTVKRKLRYHYEMKLGIQAKPMLNYIREFSGEFAEFADNDNRTSEKLEKSMEAVLQHFASFDPTGCVVRYHKPRVKQSKFLRVDDDILNSIFEYLSIFLDGYNKLMYARAVLQKDTRLIVIGGDFDANSTDAAMQKAEKYVPLLAIPKKVKKVRLIAVNILSNKTVQITGKTTKKKSTL